MNGAAQPAITDAQLSRAELIRVALDGKSRAIGGYDEILWKIRVGYAAVLYGALSLALGKEAAALSPMNRWTALYVAALVIGFSAAAAVIDAGFQSKKLKVVVARDALTDLWLDGTWPTSPDVPGLCRIAGELSLAELPRGAQNKFWPKMMSNVRWTLVPLYGLPLLVAGVTCAVLWGAR